uniref:Uncharacterized LOC105937794 n=1 Tax=Fundulus heteroclitus TaxID=8078 RepID=A0A3Q2PPC9_FUNHE
MNLWLSALLFASLILSSSAQTPEECQPLVSPVSLADPSVLYGVKHFLVGYTDQQLHKPMLKMIDSTWVNVTESPAGNTQVVMQERNRINGTCVRYNVTVTIAGNTMKLSAFNMTSEFHALPSCDGCMVYMINSTTKNAKHILQLMRLPHEDVPDEFSARSLYLLGRGQTLAESDMEHFKKQASCLGFSGEPDFIYNTEKSFCGEDEGIRLPHSA